MDWQDYYNMNTPSFYEQSPYHRRMMEMQQQQMAMQKVHKPTKKEIIDSLVYYLGGVSEVESVDEFETMQTRHICHGTKNIQVLSRCMCPVQTMAGTANVEYFFCPQCRKLIINRSSVELL